MTNYSVPQLTLFTFGGKEYFLKKYKELPFKTFDFNNFWVADCFDKYWEQYKSQEEFYFAFQACPTWIEKFVDEFNSSMKNIKIKIIENTPLYAVKKPNNYGEPIIKFYKEKPNAEHYKEVCIPAFMIEYSKEYPHKAKRYTSYIIHHALRMFSYPHKFLDINIDDPGEDYLDFLCSKLNGIRFGGRYTRNLSDKDITKEHLLNIDNIERAKYFNSDYTIKQTSILERFNTEQKIVEKERVVIEPPPVYNRHRFRIGDYVRAYGGSPYSYTNHRMGLAKVVSINSSGEIMRIQILEHSSYPDRIGSIFPVNPYYFYRVYKNGRKARPRIGE